MGVTDNSEVRYVCGRVHGESASEFAFPQLERARLGNGQARLRGVAHFGVEMCAHNRLMIKKFYKASCVQGVLRVSACSPFFQLREVSSFYTLSGVPRHAPSKCHPHSSL